MNHKIALSVFMVSIFLISSVFVLAKPDTTLTLQNNNIANVPVIIPAHAVQVTENVFSLGTAIDVDGRVVEGFLFIDNKKGFAHKSSHDKGGKPTNGGSDGGDATCFSLFAKGASWKTTEPYVTGVGVDLALTETSLNTWDSKVAFEIFGTGTSGTTDGADTVSPDGKNEVMFENLGASNTIAYAIVWGRFSGPPPFRALVEWDVVFNTAYNFGDADLDSSLMDYQNIATHEFGHSLGLGHSPDSCTEETMYAFASTGETKKRTLNAGDISGVNELYS